MSARFFSSVVLLLIAAGTALYTGSHFRSLYEREPWCRAPAYRASGS